MLRRSKSAKRKPQTRRKGKRDVGKLFEALVALQARLRAPNGCPWDREQSHDTLRPYLVEETYEVLDALDSNDPAHIAEELGDLLLQVVFHAQLGAEGKRFDIADVIEHIHTKMVRRHPHVFGKVKADTAAQVLKKWEELKAEERASRAAQKNTRAQKKVTIRPGLSSRGASRRGTASAEPPPSVLDGVPRSLPSLLEAHQLTRRAANVGFDWRDIGGILEKLNEETLELREALQKPQVSRQKSTGRPELQENRSRIEDEVGDLLFVCVNLARFLKLDAEIALKKANLKFSRRFREMERAAAHRSQKLSELSTDDLEKLWTEAKGITA